MSPPFRSIVLTGASGGIGLALAEAFSAQGCVFLLLGRDQARLERAKASVEEKGGIAECASIDLRDTFSLLDRIRTFDQTHPIDLLICNAGVKTGNTNGIEAEDALDRVISVNFSATLKIVQTVLPNMQARRNGTIALVSSLAALSPHADLLSYSATKAALQAYATALRRSVRKSGVHVASVAPGFVDTPMTDRQHGPHPMLMTPEKAARLIRRGLERKKKNITFPRLLFGLCKIMEALPPVISDTISDRYRAEITPDDDERR